MTQATWEKVTWLAVAVSAYFLARRLFGSVAGPIKPATYAQSKDQLARMWQGMRVSAQWAPKLERAVSAIQAMRPAYESLAAQTGAPWWWIGPIHYMEGASNPRARIRDGQRLADGVDWKSDALATLSEQIGSWRDWTIPGALWMAERYNGLGYRKHGVATPYVWSGTPYYQKGKFVADGVYDPNHVSQQVGVAPIMQALLSRGLA